MDPGSVFRLVFAAADVFLGFALVAVLVMEERPLRGPTSAPSAAAAEPPPAPAE